MPPSFGAKVFPPPPLSPPTASMASFPFRPPQFSDDAAWLPAWLQSSQAATPLNQLTEDSLHHSVQGMDPLKGDNIQVKDPRLQPSIGNTYNIGQLYLSGEENTPLTLTPSCEKVLHFNLHLSTDGISSDISSSCIAKYQDDRLNSARSKPVQIVEALHGSQETSQSRMEHNSSTINLFPTSNEKGSGNVNMDCNQAQCNSTSAKQGILNTFNSTGTEFDDVNDAVELSVAASEALVIHELVQSGPVSEGLSAAAILEVALRVKQARLDGLRASLCCSKDDGDITDILSDFSDSDMEDAFRDVGLSVNNLDSLVLKESSISRVKDTPMSEFYPREEREVQSEQQRDQEICFSSNLATQPLEENLDGNTLKDLLTEFLDSSKQEMVGRMPRLDSMLGDTCGFQDKKSGDLQITLGGESIVNKDRVTHQLEVKSPSLAGKASDKFEYMMQHSHCVDINKVNDRPTCRFQSRWFGGWAGKEEGDACGVESKGIKMIRRLFVAESSYLSESVDVASDQNSFVHNHHHRLKASESSVALEGSYGTTGADRLIDQDIVKDSYIDPLCSIVPCSISAEINDSPHTTNNNEGIRVLDAVNSEKACPEIPEIPLGNVQSSSGGSGENVGTKNRDELLVDAIGPSNTIGRQLTSLRPYSVGLPGSSLSPLKRAFKCSLASRRDNSETFLFGNRKIHSTKCRDENDLMKLLPVKPTSTSDCSIVKSDDKNHETRFLLKEQLIGCANTSREKVHRERPSFGSLNCDTAISNEENHETSGFGNASVRPIQDDFEQNAKNGAELQLQEIQTSPLVLSRRTRCRFKAPKLPVPDFSTANQVEDQGPGSDMVYHHHREIPRDTGRKLTDGDIPARKKVRFSEIDIKFHPKKSLRRILTRSKTRSSCRARDGSDLVEHQLGTASQEVKERLTNCRIKGRKRAIFQGLEFLITGFSKKKEKEIEALLRKHGGMVLSDIPSPPPRLRGRRSMKFDAQKLPVILCTKKLQTTKFLYGCAVNAFLLKPAWAHDSIKAGSVLLPDKYIISFNQSGRNLNQIGQSVCHNSDSYIFDKVGIMLHGRNNFSSKLVKVIKHGQGHVYRSLHWLVQSLESKKISLGAVVTEDENRATRHLKKCAAEQKIPVVPASWIIRSLFEGKLLPFDDQNHYFSTPPATEVPSSSTQQDWSQEI